MHTQGVFLRLDTLTLSNKCSRRSPSLGAILFKIDQDSVSSAAAGYLIYSGNHKNLAMSGMAPGATIPIPDVLNSYSTPVTTICAGSTRLPALFGIAVLVMNDRGYATAYSMAAGYAAFKKGVKTVVDGLAAKAIRNGYMPRETDIDDAFNVHDLDGKVSAAAGAGQNLFENLWTRIGGRPQIRSAIHTWSQDDFDGSAETKQLSLTIDDVWRIDGHVTLADPCPVYTSAALLDPFFHLMPVTEKKRRSLVPSLAFLLNLLQDFKEKKQVLKEAYLEDWWRLARLHTPELAYRLTVHKETRDGLLVLTQHLMKHLQDDDRRISSETIRHIDYFLGLLSDNASSRFRKDIQQTLSMIPLLYNKTLTQALRLVASARQDAILS
ncbi:MAG TPA: hypothetical protein VG605_22515 [Puia sp.]|nr:hypothetical protein [Puia sp.]